MEDLFFGQKGYVAQLAAYLGQVGERVCLLLAYPGDTFLFDVSKSCVVVYQDNTIFGIQRVQCKTNVRGGLCPLQSLCRESQISSGLGSFCHFWQNAALAARSGLV